MTKDNSNKDDHSLYADNQYFGCDEKLEFNIPEDYQEFTNLSQDREFSHEEHKEEEGKTRSKVIQRILAAFIASAFTLVTAVSSNSFDSSSSQNEPIYDPVDSQIITDVIEDYEIVGYWSNGNESYRFLEDGTGYYTNGTYVILLEWEKSDNDYHIQGGGINIIDKENNTFTYWNNECYSLMTQDGLLLNSSNYTMSTFKESELTFDDSFIISRLGLSLEERVQGFFEYKETIVVSPDVTDLKPSYYLLDSSTLTTDIGSDNYSYYEHFVTNYSILDNYQIYCSGEFTYEVSEGNHTYRYKNEDLYLYYFLTQNEECLLADVFSGKHILHKIDMPF